MTHSWYDLPLSVRRHIASQFGVGPCGAKSEHLWTMEVVEAATARGELEIFRAAVADAVRSDRANEQKEGGR